MAEEIKVGTKEFDEHLKQLLILKIKLDTADKALSILYSSLKEAGIIK